MEEGQGAPTPAHFLYPLVVAEFPKRPLLGNLVNRGSWGGSKSPGLPFRRGDKAGKIASSCWLLGKMELKKALVQQLATKVIVTRIAREFCALRYIVAYETDICSSIREDA
jgi:hypothetical protein